MHVRGVATALLLGGAISALCQAPCAESARNVFARRTRHVQHESEPGDGTGGGPRREGQSHWDTAKRRLPALRQRQAAGDLQILGGKGGRSENSRRTWPPTKPRLTSPRRPWLPRRPSHSALSLYLFDDVHTSTADLIQARDAADRHLAESLDATTRAAIFTTSGLGQCGFHRRPREIARGAAEADGAAHPRARRARNARTSATTWRI